MSVGVTSCTLWGRELKVEGSLQIHKKIREKIQKCRDRVCVCAYVCVSNKNYFILIWCV